MRTRARSSALPVDASVANASSSARGPRKVAACKRDAPLHRLRHGAVVRRAAQFGDRERLGGDASASSSRPAATDTSAARASPTSFTTRFSVPATSAR